MYKKLCIILVFRDRDCIRVKKCLDSLCVQTYTDFSVVFVDYGSSAKASMFVKELVEKYHFVQYLYSHTRGMVWNRSHALNTGLCCANSEYVLFADIDLIYDPLFLQLAMKNAAPERLVSAAVHFLPENFSVPTKEALVVNRLPLSRVPNGAVILLSRKTMNYLNGFDEYYCFWGVEDRDFLSRLDRMGIAPSIVDPYEAPVLHQWHPIVSDQKQNFFPDRWWDTMNIYYQSQIDFVRRNPGSMGKLFTEEDRPVFAAVVKDFAFPAAGDSYIKAQAICSLVQAVTELQPHEALRFELPFLTKKGLLKRKMKEVFAFFQNMSTEGFYLQEDIFYTVWELILRGKISDYSFDYYSDRLVCTLMGRVPS